MSDTVNKVVQFSGLLMVDGKCVPFSFPASKPEVPAPEPLETDPLDYAEAVARIARLSNEVAALEAENARLRAIADAADGVRRAIGEPGPYPPHHARVLHDHMEQWPTLWQRIDLLIRALGAAYPYKWPAPAPPDDVDGK